MSGSFHLRRGFSLVEVVLALGIISFALVGLFGMLPFGLTIFNRAVNQTVSTQISQELTNMIQRTPFASLDKLGSERADEKQAGTTSSFYYYDAEGTLLSAIPSKVNNGAGAVGSANPLNPVYRAQIYVAGLEETSALFGTPKPWVTPLANLKAVHIDVRNLTMPAAEEQRLVTYVANSGF